MNCAEAEQLILTKWTVRRDMPILMPVGIAARRAIFRSWISRMGR